MAPQRDIEWKFLHFFVRGTKWGRSKTCRPLTTVCAIKKRMGDGEDVNRPVGNDRNSVVDYDSMWDATRRTASHDISQPATNHNSLENSTPAVSRITCDNICDFAHFVSRNFQKKSAETFTRLSLCGAMLKYTITYFFLQCHSHRALSRLNKTG